MNTIKDRMILLAATGGGLGRIPVAPGTFGTLAGIPLVFFLDVLEPGWSVFVVMLTVLAAVWIADEAEKLLGQKDPGCIVIDEIVGYMVTLAGMPVSAMTLLAGFFLFRVFDILKPQPAKYFDQHFHGGAGIVMDDLVAGLFGALILRLVF